MAGREARRTLADFTRNADEHVARLRKTGLPELLRVKGKAEVVVQDAKAYRKLLAAAERADVLDAVREGLEDIRAGRVQPAEEAFEELRRKRRVAKRA